MDLTSFWVNGTLIRGKQILDCKLARLPDKPRNKLPRRRGDIPRIWMVDRGKCVYYYMVNTRRSPWQCLKKPFNAGQYFKSPSTDPRDTTVRMLHENAVYAVYAISLPDTRGPTAH